MPSEPQCGGENPAPKPGEELGWRNIIQKMITKQFWELKLIFLSNFKISSIQNMLVRYWKFVHRERMPSSQENHPREGQVRTISFVFLASKFWNILTNFIKRIKILYWNHKNSMAGRFKKSEDCGRMSRWMQSIWWTWRFSILPTIARSRWQTYYSSSKMIKSIGFSYVFNSWHQIFLPIVAKFWIRSWRA